MSTDPQPSAQLPVPQMPPAPVAAASGCFFLDVDGTLIEIAERPQLVRVDEPLSALLATLAQAADGALALVSGRPIADIERLFGARFCIAGQHGAERRDAQGRLHRHPLPLEGLRRATERLRRFAEEHPQLVFEDKGLNLALHFRLAPWLAPEVETLFRALAAELAPAFELQAGKMVFEIKPSGRNKGTAIAEFLEERPFRGRLPVFIGDDLTDEYGFEIINRAGGLSLKVGNGPTAARARLADAAAVRIWLARCLATPPGVA